MDEKTNKKAIIWLTTAHLVNDTFSGFLNPIMPILASKIGFSMFIATILTSVAQICSSLIQPIFGFFADNILKRFFIFWGLIFGTVFIPIGANSKTLGLLLACIILGNLGGSLFHPQATGFVSRFSKNNFVSNMGLFITAGTFGFAFGPFISGLITDKLGLDKMPYLSIVGIILALLMFKFVPKISAIEKKPEHKDFIKTFKIILANNKMLILTTISIMKSLILTSCSVLLPFLWAGQGHKASYCGLALFLFLLAGGFGSLLSGSVEAKIGAKPVFYFSMILTCPMMFLFILTYQSYPYLSLAIFVLMGFTTMFAQPVTMVMAQRILPEYKSIVSGIINGFSWGIVAVVLTVVGFFAQEFGITKVLMIVSIFPVIFSYLVKYLPENCEIK